MRAKKYIVEEYRKSTLFKQHEIWAYDEASALHKIKRMLQVYTNDGYEQSLAMLGEVG